METLKSKEYYKTILAKSDWNADELGDILNLIESIGRDYLKMDFYPNQYEIVTSEQLLDVYSSIGLPVNYGHWSFGKDFMINNGQYQKGQQNLSYELVINSNPCISYNLESNTTMMQTLVAAHAAVGHNHFFKNNYMFKEWTDADNIIQYMNYARNYILKCEERYGVDEVEKVLDAAHALKEYGVDRYKKVKKSLVKDTERVQKLSETDFNAELFKSNDLKENKGYIYKDDIFLETTEENILYFIEKNAPKLPVWKREIIRIVRKVGQYFTVQGLTKVANEGCATFTHYHIIHKLYEDDYVTDAFMLEFYKSHCGVINQYSYMYQAPMNPYTLGFNILMGIKEHMLNPTKESQEFYGTLPYTDWRDMMKYVYANYRDDSLILQFLSPKIIKDMGLFNFAVTETSNFITVDAIHNEKGYDLIRKKLSDNYNPINRTPSIVVTGNDKNGDRTLHLQYIPYRRRQLSEKYKEQVLDCIRYLWEFPVKLETKTDI